MADAPEDFIGQVYAVSTLAGVALIQVVGGFTHDDIGRQIFRILGEEDPAKPLALTAETKPMDHFLWSCSLAKHDPKIKLLGSTTVHHTDMIPLYCWKMYRVGWVGVKHGREVTLGKVLPEEYAGAKPVVPITRDDMMMMIEIVVWNSEQTKQLIEEFFPKDSVVRAAPSNGPLFEARFFLDFPEKDAMTAALRDASAAGFAGRRTGFEEDGDIEVLLSKRIRRGTEWQEEEKAKEIAERYDGCLVGNEFEL